MNVLSLFDGMSCGQIALNRLGFKIDNYFAAEIDKHAIIVTQANYPSTIQLGDITKIKGKDLPEIDLLIGGSPCQGFSFAGKQLNFEDPRSKLFFEFVRLLKETKPKYFFLENVKMKKEFQDVISEYLGVQPIELNSNLVSAQNRKRLYWTNIDGFTMPEDKGIMLKDIVHENTIVNPNKDLKLEIPEATKKGYAEIEIGQGLDLTFLKSKTRRGRTMKDKSNCLTASPCDYFILEDLEKYKVPFDKTLLILDKEIQQGKVGYFRKDSQANRVYYIHGKAVTLCGDAGGGAARMGQYLFGCISPDRVEKRQLGQRFNKGDKFYTLTAQDKHGILIEGYIRKLTPIECERLQTVPNSYTRFASDPQRYRMLGNGWTVDAVTEFFKHIPRDLELF